MKIFIFLTFLFLVSTAFGKPREAFVGGIIISYDETEVILRQDDGKKVRIPRDALASYKHLTPGKYVSFQLIIPDTVRFSP